MKLVFALSDLERRADSEEVIVVFPTSKLWISGQPYEVGLTKQSRDGLWDVELSSSENGNWSRYYLGNFYFKKELCSIDS
jgi:hypothetical protein